MADDIQESWLISLVEERPVIWDRTIAEYKDKARTFEAWREISATLNQEFPSMTNGEKILYGKRLTKKWNSLRDSWMKCHKKLLHKTTEEAKKVKKYFFYDQMIFLSKIAPSWGHSNDSNTFEERCDTSEDEDSDYNNIQTSYKKRKVEPPETRNVVYYIDQEEDSIPTPNKKKKIEMEMPQIKDYVSNEVDARLLKLINSIQDKEKCSPVMSFFKGIEPTVAKFDETDLVEFQFEVLSVVRNIQQKNYSMK
ncbi:uncharacterized protein [Maniola hyperantus]|uniref:uncharacterized protein n=1 Tax=Aphantopus hyperantus TaxID=2795564 RepID=UPI0015697AD4|nr:uncharacterized protein LOC117992027 [Maniola hyperantus]